VTVRFTCIVGYVSCYVHSYIAFAKAVVFVSVCLFVCLSVLPPVSLLEKLMPTN